MDSAEAATQPVNGCVSQLEGSTYVPGLMYKERMVDECPQSKGTARARRRKLHDAPN
jgi:hypothetical protein